jgi:hypothetical protein
MIVWLASFPRSGNTLLRIILKDVFGVGTHSIYDDMLDIGADGQLSALVGHVHHGEAMAEFVDKATASEDRYYIKTHGYPVDDQPAIYVVRDGRSSVVSYWHYRNEIVGSPCTLEDVVLGDDFVGMWSEHVSVWALRKRPNTLVLRYEDLVAGNPDALGSIGAFLNLEPIAAFDVDFKSLHAAAPKFFRSGSNTKNIEELEVRCPALFDALHGGVMKKLGYAKRIQERPASVLANEIRAVAAAMTAAQPPAAPLRKARPAKIDLADWSPVADGQWTPIEGFDDPEGPYPDLGLTEPFRWTLDASCRIAVFSKRAGRRQLALTLRGAVPNQQVRVSRVTPLKGKAAPLQGQIQTPHRLQVAGNFPAGVVELMLDIDPCLVAEDRTVGVIVDDATFVDVEPDSPVSVDVAIDPTPSEVMPPEGPNPTTDDDTPG